MLGTPTEKEWPGVTALRDWHDYPQWKPQSLARAVPTLEPEGVDLLSVSNKIYFKYCSFFYFTVVFVLFSYPFYEIFFTENASV